MTAKLQLFLLSLEVIGKVLDTLTRFLKLQSCRVESTNGICYLLEAQVFGIADVVRQNSNLINQVGLFRNRVMSNSGMSLGDHEIVLVLVRIVYCR